jgi:purine nucleosidase
MRPVIFDTDIGTDVDDILALVLLAKAPELNLRGITTVYGDTLLRAKIAQVTARLLGRTDLAILPGAQQTLSGRQIHWAGHEGEGVPDLVKSEIHVSQSVEEYIAENAERFPGELEILATGPLTNIAKAITAAPGSLAKIKQLYIMGGAFWLNRAEHNIKCDTVAAEIVFDSGLPITAIGLDVTLRVWMARAELAQITTLPNGLGALLEDQVLRWWEYRHRDQNNPHDPLAALAMVRPDLFRFENWDVEVYDDQRAPGFTRSSNPGIGKIKLASDVLVATAEKEIIARIAAP